VLRHKAEEIRSLIDVEGVGSSLADGQEKLLEPFRRIVLLLDGDNAGREAAAAIAARLVRRFFVRVVEVPDGSDPAELTTAEIKGLLHGVFGV
jgi:DNA primase